MSSTASEAFAVKIYNAVLSKIEEWLGVGETYDYQLSKLCRELFDEQFGGVISRNQFINMTDQRTDTPLYYIVNLDEKPGGSHWIAAIFHDPLIYVYDSYGRSTLEMFPELEGKKNNIDADTDPEQALLEDNCGQRCIAWLYVAHVFGIDYALKI